MTVQVTFQSSELGHGVDEVGVESEHEGCFVLLVRSVEVLKKDVI